MKGIEKMKKRKPLVIGLTLGRRQFKADVPEQQVSLEDEYASSIQEQIEIAQQAERAKVDFYLRQTM